MEAKRVELGVAGRCEEPCRGLTGSDAGGFGREGNVKTLDDFAGFTGDDLRGWFETKNGERVREPGVLEIFPADTRASGCADPERAHRGGLDRSAAGTGSGRRDPRKEARMKLIRRLLRTQHRQRRAANASGAALSVTRASQRRRDPDPVRAVAGWRRHVPDVGAKLPGRGAWVRADRESLGAAQVKKGAFARAFKAEVKASGGPRVDLDRNAAVTPLSRSARHGAPRRGDRDWRHAS